MATNLSTIPVMNLLSLLLLIATGNVRHTHARRGKRINIFSGQASDIRPPFHSSVPGRMYSALPKESLLKWDRMRDLNGSFIIPFQISGIYDPDEQQVIFRAMKAIEDNVCIRFKKRTKQRSYVDIQNKQNLGCYTSVGRFPGRNVVMLEANSWATCIEHDIVIHELFHVLGLWHEHMRHDRDQYIRVHYGNIEPRMYSQFDKISPSNGDSFGIGYDYRSVMHYGKDAFTKKRGAITMETLDPKYQDVIGNAQDAQPSDYHKLCALYECTHCIRKVFNLSSVQQTRKTTKIASKPIEKYSPSGNLISRLRSDFDRISTYLLTKFKPLLRLVVQ